MHEYFLYMFICVCVRQAQGWLRSFNVQICLYQLRLKQEHAPAWTKPALVRADSISTLSTGNQPI